MADHVYDVAVIGAGIVGSSAAYSLAKYGTKTALIDQFYLPHTRGSSHGRSRITRKAYQQVFYTRMMTDAFHMWDVLEKESGDRIFKNTGLLVFGDKGDPSVINSEKSMTELKSDFSKYNAGELREKFPQFRVMNSDVGLLDREAGILNADIALAAYWKLFKQYGGSILQKMQVREIIPGEIITIRTSSENVLCKKLVITAGPWTNSLLKPLGLSLPLKPCSIKVCFWKIRDQSRCEEFHHNNCPVFIYDGNGDGNHFYGIPVDEYPGMFKVCAHFGTNINDPDKRDENLANQKDLDATKQFIRTHMPDLCWENGPSIMEKCIYTVTPDDNYVIDKLPTYKNIIIGAGFSGHGFKLAPVSGKLLAELATERDLSHDISHFSISRFSKKNSKL